MDQELCWYNKFSAKEPQCKNPGTYGLQGRFSNMLLAFKWCEVHRHKDDVWLPEKGE